MVCTDTAKFSFRANRISHKNFSNNPYLYNLFILYCHELNTFYFSVSLRIDLGLKLLNHPALERLASVLNVVHLYFYFFLSTEKCSYNSNNCFSKNIGDVFPDKQCHNTQSTKPAGDKLKDQMTD